MNKFLKQITGNAGIKMTTLCLALGSAGFMAAAHAEAPASGFQIGIDGGKAELDGVCDNVTNCESSDKSFRGNIGYQFNPYAGVEVGYTSFGTIYDTQNNEIDAEQEAGAFTASVIGTIPLGDKFGLFGRVGAARYDLENNGTIQGLPVKGGDGETKPYYGAGARVNLTENFALRAEYQIYKNLAGVDGNNDDVNVWSGGALFTF
ncbi:MAG: outer membrane beta-barrel protein [Pedobacter sp.]|nr:outer membrane beta-barrel protein [Pedobacter sp.]